MFNAQFVGIIRRAILVFGLVGVLVVVSGCGGGSSQSTPPPPAAKTATQLKIGDAASDRVISFEVSISSPIVVTTSTGTQLQILLGANRLELSHMSARMEPLTVVNAPQGSYTGVSMTLTNPEVTFLDNSGVAHSLQGSASQTVNVTLNPPLTIGSAAAVVSIDVNVANSLTTDVAGNITGFSLSSSSFTIGTKPVATANQQDDDGELEDLTGLVASVSGNNFVVNLGQSGAQLTFATDSTTQFSDGVADVNSALNQIVKVEGTTKADGTLFALRS